MKKNDKKSFLLLSNSENATIDDIRKKLLSWMLILLNVWAFPGIILASIEAIQLGQSYLVHIYIFCFLMILAGLIFQKKLPYFIIVLFILLSTFLLGMINLWEYGFSSAAIPIFILLIVLCTVFLGLKSGIYSIGVSIIPMIIFAFLMTNNIITIRIDLMEISRSPIAWLAAIFVLVLCGGILVLSYGMIQHNLLHTLKTVRKQAFDLQIANDKQVEVMHNMTIMMKELRIAKENAEESDKLKTEFIHNISHEVRTPLNGILGFSQLITTPDLSPKDQNNYLDMLKDCSKQLLKVIEDILEISALETKQVVRNESEFCLNSLLQGLLIKFNTQSHEKNISLNLENQLSDDSSMILTDEIKLNKVLANILENAFKFTNEGSIEFGYKIIKNTIELYVKDTGIGIRPENLEKIFERFSQENKELSRSADGIGLGLSIAKENALLIGGNITVESEKDKGTTFFVTIPYKTI